MFLKEDCINFRSLNKDIAGLGERQERFMNIPNCKINKMAMGGCPETCSFFDKIR